jgi:YD repeat-containing protein
MIASINPRAFARTLLAIIGLACAAPVCADPAQVSVPADHFVMTPGGVDMRTGRYGYSDTDLSIGGDGGLALTRIMPDYAADHANPFGNFSHNWDITLIEMRVDIDHHLPAGTDYRMTAHVGGRVMTFESENIYTAYDYKSGGPVAVLTYAGGTRDSSTVVYTLRSSDGTIMTFRPMGGLDCANQYWYTAVRRCAFVSQIVQPDGTTLSFDYTTTGGSTGNLARLRKVTSSRGYALLLEGSGSLVTKACVLNLAVAPAPSGGLCPSGVPTTTYSYASFSRPSLASVTGPGPDTASFTYALSGSTYTMGFIKPGQSSAWLTNTFFLNRDEEYSNQEIVTAQSFADGRIYNYTYDNPPLPLGGLGSPSYVYAVAGGHYSDNLGRTTYVTYGFPATPGTDAYAPCFGQGCVPHNPDDDYRIYQQTQGPIAVIDPLGRTNTADYCDPYVTTHAPSWYISTCATTVVQSYTDPEGGKTMLSHDGWGNVTQARHIAKPGSGLADIVTSATFASCTTNPTSCTKPLTATDARGNLTTYTYDSTHGGVLTETDPADSHGVQRVKRYAYVQRYAWISNGSGGYVHSATPVWLLASEKSCNSSATVSGACTGTNDEISTVYDYGPDTGAVGNTLLLRGTAVTAFDPNVAPSGAPVTLLTCYAYDPQGNRISETKPRGTTGLTVCP